MKTPKSAAMVVKVDEWKNITLTMKEFASTICLSRSAVEYLVRKKRESMGNLTSF